MEKRRLGSTGEELSVVGFGGIVVMNESQESANRFVAQAIDRGVNYFDVAPSYGDAEERLGPALKPYRDSVFLSCKTSERIIDKAWEELHQSLKRLQTDHVDLYLHHAVTTLEEVDTIMDQGGAMEAFVQAKGEGLTRYLGFSAHSEEAALAMMDRYPFDVVVFPVNWAAWLKRGFGPSVVEKAQQMNAGIIALKALAERNWRKGEDKTWPKCWYKPVDSPEEAMRGLSFTLSTPVTSAISPSHAELLWLACDAADNLRPLTEEELQEMGKETNSLSPAFPLGGRLAGEL